MRYLHPLYLLKIVEYPDPLRVTYVSFKTTNVLSPSAIHVSFNHEIRREKLLLRANGIIYSRIDD